MKSLPFVVAMLLGASSVLAEDTSGKPRLTLIPMYGSKGIR